MLKLLNKSGIPNVIDFSLTDPTYNELALLAGFDVKQRTFKSESEARRNAKANNYLAKQFNRLRKHAEKGNFEAFNKVGLNLLQNSTSYLIYSFNSVNPKWTSMDFNKVIKMLKGVRKLCKTLATDIDYKRVWIDKKPGDYARPLGVPEMIWRVYLRMVTNEGEIFAHGRDLYHPSQHGGRPGYGVMSCLKEVAETLPRFKKVYEFDLKGFFDHISHTSMTTIFKDTFLEGLYSKMLTSRPKSFKLPPIEKDKAVKVYNENQLFEFFEIFFREDNLIDITPKEGDLNGKWFVTISLENGVKPVIINKEPLKQNLKEEYWDNWRIMYTPMGELGTRVRIVAYSNNFSTDFFYQEKMLEIHELTLEKIYKLAMDKGYIASSEINPFAVEKSKFSEKDRALGRDNWKDLNLETQGVPQGTSFGPFLSSLAVSVYYKEQALKDWIMYIDDGLIFHNTAEELAEKLVRLNKALDKMSVELAPEKSRLHTYESLIDNSIKFLGIRFKNTPGTLIHRRNFFTISSDTRSGTVKNLPPINTEQMLTILENMLQEGAITLSKYKYARWAVLQSRMRIGFEADVVTLSIKYNFFGYLLSWLYNPEMDMETTKRRINEGIRDATNEILRQRRSLGSYILRNSRWSYQDSKGMIKTTTPDLNNHSTLCVDLLLETLQNGNVSSVKRRLVSKGTSDIRSTTRLPHVAVWGPEIFNRAQQAKLAAQARQVMRQSQASMRLRKEKGNLMK
jgi:hypothetical protein